MATCDLCGNSYHSYQVHILNESYRVNGIVDLCPECGKFADKTKRELLAKITPGIRMALLERKSEIIGRQVSGKINLICTVRDFIKKIKGE